MPFTIYDAAIPPMIRSLENLSKIMDKAVAQAKAEDKPLSSLLEARLAPDMFPLSKQVQIACDQAKSVAARLTGQEPPKFEDNEQTLDELKTRIRRTLDYVKSVASSAYQGAETRRVGFPLMEGYALDMDGVQYLRDWALPNFYFHVVTAYDILRSQGVQIGKQDYLAHAGYAIRSKAS